MSVESMIEIVKAHLKKEGLVLCRTNDTQFALDGEKENQAVRDLVELQLDTVELEAEWDDAHQTTPVPPEVVAALAKASA